MGAFLSLFGIALGMLIVGGLAAKYLNSLNIKPAKKPPLTKEQIYNIGHAKNSKEARKLLNQYRGRWWLL
jgi:hypothetical protein